MSACVILVWVQYWNAWSSKDNVSAGLGAGGDFLVVMIADREPDLATRGLRAFPWANSLSSWKRSPPSSFGFQMHDLLPLAHLSHTGRAASHFTRRCTHVRQPRVGVTICPEVCLEIRRCYALLSSNVHAWRRLIHQLENETGMYVYEIALRG